MPEMRLPARKAPPGEVARRWLLIAWLAAANGLDAARTWEALPSAPEANPLLAPFAHSLWLVAAKAGTLLILCAVNVALSHRPPGGREVRMFQAGLWLASGWYLAVLVWHAWGGG